MKPLQQLRNAPPGEKTTPQAGNDTQAFTERPRTETAKRKESRLAHELFNLFTANIIKANTDFVR